MASKQANAKLALRITSGVFRWILNILFYIIVVSCVITFGKAAYTFSYQVFGDVRVDEEPNVEVKIRITKGDSTMEVARRLETKKVIVDDLTFYLKAKISKVSIMPGTYIVNSAMTYDEIFAQLSDVNNSLTKEEYQEEDKDSSDAEKKASEDKDSKDADKKESEEKDDTSKKNDSEN